jgi:hypothetical protein
MPTAWPAKTALKLIFLRPKRMRPQWIVSFMDYDLGYFDLETRVLEPLDNPFGPRFLPMYHTCLRVGPEKNGGQGRR